jgi:hypothetical protein
MYPLLTPVVLFLDSWAGHNHKRYINDYVRPKELAVIHGRLKRASVDGKIGNQTVQFIKMFFKNPDRVLESISDRYIDSEQNFEYIAPVTLLK